MPVGACREGVSVAKTGWRDIGERRNIAFENQKSHHNRERQDTTPSLSSLKSTLFAILLPND
jgi:hypothetical protein